MKSEGFKSFEREGFTSSQERELSKNERKEASFEDRAERLRGFARTRLEREEDFLRFVSKISAKYGDRIPEEVCEEIAESAEGEKFFTEGPMVLAAILEYRSLKRG